MRSGIITPTIICYVESRLPELTKAKSGSNKAADKITKFLELVVAYYGKRVKRLPR
jgi:hypothetical protein